MFSGTDRLVRVTHGWSTTLGIVIVTLLLGGCSEEALYSRLGEREANEMVAVLGQAGLPASKSGGTGDSGFTVHTTSRAFAEAVGVLQRNGLPRQHYETIGDVFANEGFVSSPLEERARLNFALSQEIAHTISSIDGVVMARVHLAVPPRDEFSNDVLPASASVFVKHRDTVDLNGSVAQIKALVVNGIENLPYENVTVALFPTDARANTTGTSAVPTQTRAVEAGLTPALGQFAPFAGPLAILALIGLGGACAWFGWLRDRRPRAAQSNTAVATAGKRTSSQGTRRS